MLAFEARKHANALGQDVGRVFLMCGSLTAFLWILYPVAWGLCEGGNVISPDSEAAFYGVLDVLAKPVFGALLLFGHRNIAPARLGLRIRDYDEDVAHHSSTKGHGIGEKNGHHGNGVGNGTGNGVTGNTGVTGTHGNGVTGNGAGPTVGTGSGHNAV
jgi:hypothetical protein